MTPEKQKTIEVLKSIGICGGSETYISNDDIHALNFAISSIHRVAKLEEALKEILNNHGNTDTGSCEICRIAQQALTKEEM